MTNLRLTIHHEDEHLWLEIPDRPGCYAAGTDLPKLLENAAEAVRLYDAAPEPKPGVLDE